MVFVSCRRFVSFAALVFMLGASGVVAVRAQWRPTVTQLFVRYRSTKNASKPTGEKAARLNEIESKTLAAYTAGKNGEVRRLIAQGMAILTGRTWGALEDYRNSLVLRTDTSVCDPSRILYVRLAQIYSCDGVTGEEKTLQLSLARPDSGTQELGRFDGVAADLVESPFVVGLDLGGVSEGTYLLQAELFAGESSIHKLSTPLYLVRGLESKRADFEQRLARIDGHESAKASIRYAFDFARRVNLGQMAGRNFDFAAELREAESILGRLEAGTDPLYQAKGLLKRHYRFAEADAIMPYRLYVPSSYDGKRSFPLVMALHGLGGTESTLMTRDGGLLPRLAEKHGYIAVTPLGYNSTGGYGQPSGQRGDSAARREKEWSEKDVMNVLDLVMKEYRVDPKRIYLMGHSMGGNGAWFLGARYHEKWAGLAPIASGRGISAQDLAKIKNIPVLLSHGDADVVALPDSSRRAAKEMQRLGMVYEYFEMPGGSHGSIVTPAFEKIFPFFDAHR